MDMILSYLPSKFLLATVSKLSKYIRNIVQKEMHLSLIIKKRNFSEQNFFRLLMDYSVQFIQIPPLYSDWPFENEYKNLRELHFFGQCDDFTKGRMSLCLILNTFQNLNGILMKNSLLIIDANSTKWKEHKNLNWIYFDNRNLSLEKIICVLKKCVNLFCFRIPNSIFFGQYYDSKYDDLCKILQEKRANIKKNSWSRWMKLMMEEKRKNHFFYLMGIEFSFLTAILRKNDESEEDQLFGMLYVRNVIPNDTAFLLNTEIVVSDKFIFKDDNRWFFGFERKNYWDFLFDLYEEPFKIRFSILDSKKSNDFYKAQEFKKKENEKIIRSMFADPEIIGKPIKKIVSIGKNVVLSEGEIDIYGLKFKFRFERRKNKTELLGFYLLRNFNGDCFFTLSYTITLLGTERFASVCEVIYYQGSLFIPQSIKSKEDTYEIEIKFGGGNFFNRVLNEKEFLDYTQNSIANAKKGMIEENIIAISVGSDYCVEYMTPDPVYFFGISFLAFTYTGGFDLKKDKISLGICYCVSRKYIYVNSKITVEVDGVIESKNARDVSQIMFKNLCKCDFQRKIWEFKVKIELLEDVTIKTQ